MGDVNQLAGGMDTIRLSAEDQTALARRTVRAKARRELLAMCVERAGLELIPGEAAAPEGVQRIGELAELQPVEAGAGVGAFTLLADMLGLDQVRDYAPGVCHRPGCSGEIPAGNAVRPHDHQRKGFCSLRCERMSYLPTRGEVSGG